MSCIPENYEFQYASSLERILREGIKQSNRTGIDTLVVQHQYFYLQNVNKNFPALRGKKIFPKLALKELIWFLSGRIDLKFLHNHNVHYWDEWEIKEGEFKGTVGKTYGYQFRNFNSIDQTEYIIRLLINDPLSRRIILNLWNPKDLPEMSISPCVYDYHFECTPITDNKYFVDLHVRSRSEDSFIGCPYDFCSVAWFLNILVSICNCLQNNNTYIARDVHFTCDNFHMYVNHEVQVKQYLMNFEKGCKEHLFDIPIIYSDTLKENWKITNEVWYINNFLANFFMSEEDWKIFQLNKYETPFDKIQANVAV